MSTQAEVEFFYLGPGDLQYFFPSRTWEEIDSQLTVESDWLYRTFSLEGEAEARTIMNFSVYSDTVTITEIPVKMVLTMNDVTLEIPREQLEIIYIDQNKTRFSCWVPSESMDSLFSGESSLLEMELSWSKSYHFQTTKHWISQFQYFRDVLLKGSTGL